MIRNLDIKNVKCFSSAKFDLSPLTVFCGANSVGKSTAIQCMLLLRQSYNLNKFKTQDIKLTGELFSVGHAKDLLSQNSKGDNISIFIDKQGFVSKNLKDIDLDGYVLPLNDCGVIEHEFFENTFHYLSAYRLAPQNSYDVNFDSSNLDLGIYGQFAISELERNRNKLALNQKLARIMVNLNRGAEASKPVFETNIQMASEEDDNEPDLEKFETIDEILNKVEQDNHKEKNNAKNDTQDKNEEYTLEVALKESMKRICKGFNIDLQSYKELDKVATSFSSSETVYSVRPVNTGFGISYVLPIMLAALCTSPGGTLIVENPEVHLHPSAQSELAFFLGVASLCDIQVIIETHSDHIINGIRLFAKKNTLELNHITINSIRSGLEGRIITKIEIDEDGSLTDIDDGFFDQAEKDLMRLFA
ncbi:putative ATPase [Yokenella regensburgei]|uniref:ATPase n=1 Tax=Yokenella regensburgei TaxID=158877 RepID=A0ABX9RVB5_9ENTR|nr:DUF3696 domain-containing protein [Yokenella regensburgei]RKR53698.1 putative ATPase [Yokenella regensburgei]VFS15080.1 Uncharacterized conserved protein [Yokenella regensburgei]